MTTQDGFGMIERDGRQSTLRYARSLAHPPERVWRVLTESEHMRYWMPADMLGEKAVDATLKMVFWPDLAEARGLDPDAGTATITVWDPPNTFAWIWNDTHIRFEITPTPYGSDLRLTVGIPTDDPDVVIDAAGGFHLWIDHLHNLVDTGLSISMAEADPEPLEAGYRAMVEGGSRP